MRGDGGGGAGSQPMSTAVLKTWHGAQINFRDLPPYLTYGPTFPSCRMSLSRPPSKNAIANSLFAVVPSWPLPPFYCPLLTSLFNCHPLVANPPPPSLLPPGNLDSFWVWNYEEFRSQLFIQTCTGAKTHLSNGLQVTVGSVGGGGLAFWGVKTACTNFGVMAYFLNICV